MTIHNPFSRLSRRAKATIAGALVLGLLVPVRSPAQWAVFDASSFAALGHIWSQDISTYAKLVQEYNELLKIYTTETAAYQMAVAMARMISRPQRTAMIALGPQILNNVTQNRYGETIQWPMAMNGQAGVVGNAWGNSTVALAPNPYLAAERLGSSILLAKLASVEATDGSSQKCMAILSRYQSNMGANQSAFALLKAAGLDITPGINSMIGQLNLQNSSNQQLRAEQQSQGQIQACLAEQQVLANKRQRDIDAETLNFIGQVHAYEAAEDDTWTDGASALQGFRLP